MMINTVNHCNCIEVNILFINSCKVWQMKSTGVNKLWENILISHFNRPASGMFLRHFGQVCSTPCTVWVVSHQSRQTGGYLRQFVFVYANHAVPLDWILYNFPLWRSTLFFVFTAFAFSAWGNWTRHRSSSLTFENFCSFSSLTLNWVSVEISSLFS